VGFFYLIVKVIRLGAVCEAEGEQAGGGRSPGRIVAGVCTCVCFFRHSPFTGANDEKSGLVGTLPRTAAAVQPCPGLLSVASTRLYGTKWGWRTGLGERC